MAFPLFHDNEDYFSSAASVRKDWIAFYDQFIGSKKNSNLYYKPLSNKRVNDISIKSQKRICKYIELLYLAARNKRVYSKKTNKNYSYKLGFLTLTLQSMQIHSDKEIHEKIFKPFIRECKNKHPEFNYIYKAETQENGNLHYHLTTNAFIHHEWLKNAWNHYCNVLGYIDRCKVNNPNSTDIKAVKNNKDLSIYLSKYISKQGEGRRIPEIKLWDCSKILKSCKTSSIMDIEQMLEMQKIPYSNLIMHDEVCLVLKINDEIKKSIPNLMQIWNKNVELIRSKTRSELSFYSI